MTKRIFDGTVQFKNGTASAWTSNNITLAKGEIGIEIDTNKMKIGDGVNPWNSLQYFPASANVFIGATSSAAGAAGLVPAPAKGTQTDYYLSADGTWKKVQQRSIKEVIDIVHPVGSIWETTTTDDPNILWAGTTWVKMDAGRVLVSAGTAATGTVYTAGATGGEEKHQLTVEEMASHSHTASTNTASLTGSMTLHGVENSDNSASGIVSISGTAWVAYNSHGSDVHDMPKISIDASHGHTVTINNVGNNTAHNIMQPYEVIYRWRRTA